MARKKNKKVSSKKYVYDGDGDGDEDGLFSGSGCGDAAINAGHHISSVVGKQNSANSMAVILATSPVDDKTSPEDEFIHSFYDKLVMLHQSSGLSLVFNFQEAKVDLYLLYKNVTQRGGFHQVSKEGKWNEVVYGLNLKMQVSLLSSQVQKLYENLLLQYEQMHYYRTPAKFHIKPAGCGSFSTYHSRFSSCHDTNIEAAKGKDVLVVDMDQASSKGKRKASENSSYDDQVGERNGAVLDINSASTTGPNTPEKKMNLQKINFDDNDIKDLHLPTKPRTAYQMFVKMECDRLRKLHDESSSSISYRNMATEAWKHLSQSERAPYIEASQKDKARFNRDMVVYEQIWNQKIAKKQKLLNNSSKSIINFGTPVPPDDGYYVKLEEDAAAAEHFCVPDESLVETTIQILKGSRPNDPMFQINWDGCCYGSPNSRV